MSAAPPRTSSLGPTLWWTRPHVFLLTVTLPIFGVLVASAHRVITANHAGYTSADFVTPGYVALFLLGLAVFGGASYGGGRLPPVNSTLSFADNVLDGLFWLTVASYALWFGPLFLGQPQLVLGALTGQAGAVYDVRALNLNVSGVTTVTQFGITYVCLYGTKRFTRGEAMPRRFGVYLGALLLLALFRAIVNSERIALLELVFPLVVILSRTAARRAQPFRLVLQAFPLITIFGSTVLFAIFEYNRSWLIHYQFVYDNLFEFAFERLAIYYVSALNNICGFMQHTAWPTYHGEWTFNWAYRLPGLGGLLQSTVSTPRGDIFGAFLMTDADPEFNNPTGILTVFDDWGLPLGLLFLAATGFLVGRGYRSYESGRGVMQYIYPILFYHIYELLRIGYAYDGRGMAAFIGLGLALLVGGRRMSRPLAMPAPTLPC